MDEKQQNDDFNTSDHADSVVNTLEQSSIQHSSMNNKSFLVKNPRVDDKLELEVRQIYEKLCRQEQAQLSHERQATLFCRYRHNNHPYLLLRPVKEEQVLDEPAVFLFHDVVSDSDIEKVKALAIPRLKRALVRDTATGGVKQADF
ncbi:unnamed protein product [Rotaria socialis]|uniref:Uncharacterized protein n=1 Tax=Rotaria socialis TaxID=392032 RepID=A0A821UXV6_9BILA|nr:unnamed protein product [Rotaria socialis]